MMLDKKQIQAIFLFEFKMGCKAVETTHNINNTFGPGTAKEHTVQWWFKKFYEGDKRLEDEEPSGQPLEVDNNQLRATEKLILLQTMRSVTELNADYSTVIRRLKKIGKMKKLSKWVPPDCKSKNIVLKCHLLTLYTTTTNRLSIGLRHATKSGLYMTVGDD